MNLEPVCAKAGIDEDELAELLGEHHYQMIQACAFEDFVIDDYFDQRAWKESIQGRDYLRVLRDSVISLYEVVEVRRGRGLVLRDLIRVRDIRRATRRQHSLGLRGEDSIGVLLEARIIDYLGPP